MMINKVLRRAVLTCAMSTAFILHTAPSYACGPCMPIGTQANSTANTVTNQVNNDVTQLFQQNFNDQKTWLNNFWDSNILPSLKGMADELSATAMYQAFVVGTFFDAKAQLETQQSLQKIKARAHKDYHPSTGMCKFGSVSQSLSASERKGELNALVLERRSRDRDLGNVSALSAFGELADVTSRIDYFKQTYCNPADHNGQLDVMCAYDSDGDGSVDGVGGTDPNRLNKDIDFVRTLDAPWTIKVDFSDTTNADDETDIVALANNLYGYDILGYLSALAHKDEDDADGQPKISDAKKRDYLRARSLLAKRSVAENSFNAMVALKSEGTEGAKDYIISVMEGLGVGSDEADAAKQKQAIETLIGEKPSYYAQMEVLTKKLYQNPEFYTNLYDKPANVQRKEVALQAIALMQKFDMFKSYLRSEASLAVLLETALMQQQSAIENQE